MLIQVHVCVVALFKRKCHLYTQHYLSSTSLLYYAILEFALFVILANSYLSYSTTSDCSKFIAMSDSNAAFKFAVVFLLGKSEN